MKSKLFVFLLVFQCFYVKAQNKLSVGIDINSQITALSLTFGAKNKNILMPGVGIGLLKSFKEDRVQLKSGLTYQLSTIEFDNVPHYILDNGEVYNVGTKDQVMKQNFISLPIAINYRVLGFNKFAFQVFGGTQLSYLYRTKYQINSSYNGETEDVTQPNTLFPFVDAGLSFYFKPENRIQLFFKPKFTYGFKQVPFSDQNNWLGLNLELYYNLR